MRRRISGSSRRSSTRGPAGRTAAAHESDRRRRRRRRLIVPLVVLLVLGVAGAGALYGGRSLLGRFGTTPDFQGQGTGDVLIRVQPGDTATDIAATLVAAGRGEERGRVPQRGEGRPALGLHPAGDLPAAQGDERRLRARADARPDGPGAGPGDRPGGVDGRGHPEADLGQDRRCGWPTCRRRRRTPGRSDLPGVREGPAGGLPLPGDVRPGARHVRGRAARTRWSPCTRTKVDTSGLSARAADVDLDPYQLLIVASLVERETQRVEERPKVARVIYNRLRAGLLPRRRRRDPVRAGPVRRRAVRRPTWTKRTPYNNRLARACRRHRSPTPGSPRCRPRWSRRPGRGSTTSSTTTAAGGTSSPTTPTCSTPPRRSAGPPDSADPGGGPSDPRADGRCRLVALRRRCRRASAGWSLASSVVPAGSVAAGRPRGAGPRLRSRRGPAAVDGRSGGSRAR